MHMRRAQRAAPSPPPLPGREIERTSPVPRVALRSTRGYTPRPRWGRRWATSADAMVIPTARSQTGGASIEFGMRLAA